MDFDENFGFQIDQHDLPAVFLTCCFVVQLDYFFVFCSLLTFSFLPQSQLMHKKQFKDSFCFRSVMVLSPSDDVIILS